MSERPVALARFTVSGGNYADCLARAELIAREFFADDDWEIVRFDASPEAMDKDGTVTLWRAEVAAG